MNQRSRSPSAVLAAERSIFRAQLGLATRTQLLEMGVADGQLRVAVAQGRWSRTAAGLYALPSHPDSPGRRLLAACLLTGGVASHASAAWVWSLLDDPPTPPVASVAHKRHATLATTATRDRSKALSAGSVGPNDLYPVVVHRSRDLAPTSISVRNGIPTTNPLRTFVDLAGSISPTTLDEAIDVALAKRLVSVESLLAEAGRQKRSGRRGPAQLMAHLDRRRFVGAPAPSVLESRALRLLADARIKVVNCETAIDHGHYRLDIELEHQIFVEVDGYAYHSSPEQKRYDDARRNQLRLMGVEFLVYDWRAVMEGTGGVLVREAMAALTAKGSRRRSVGPAAKPHPVGCSPR
jgi:very-short-patch-repair endonuclease